MILHDKNQSWTPPEGYQLVSFGSEGAYCRAEYEQAIYAGTRRVMGRNVVVVYLNDMGREVARTERQEYMPPPVTEAPVAIGRWFRFRNGFLIALQGIQEMFRSFKRSVT